MTRDSASPAPTAEEVLGAATVQVTGADGSVGGLGVVIAPTLVLTCAHVVLDALRLPREHADRPAAPVRVCLALGGGEESEAVVRDWVPERIGTVVRLTLAARHGDPDGEVWLGTEAASTFAGAVPGRPQAVVRTIVPPPPSSPTGGSVGCAI